MVIARGALRSMARAQMEDCSSRLDKKHIEDDAGSGRIDLDPHCQDAARFIGDRDTKAFDSDGRRHNAKSSVGLGALQSGARLLRR